MKSKAGAIVPAHFRDSVMHIPDGYLSPSTCAGLYAAAAPFWYLAMKRVRAKLATQTLPLLTVFSAFSFVLMMFNLPLPGGTTGHAVGVGIASVVLGPWVSILGVSIALFVQAVFFGDGGISAYGANCFNMAIAGSLVAHGVYRVGSFGAGDRSSRRVLAAGLAGYAGVNVAAFLAALEFGIQPLLFHDPGGTPLYAPYPLKISVPAMMIGHLTFAGLAEFLVTTALVKYLVRVDPVLVGVASESPALAPIGSRRKLWGAVAIAVCLTPLGVLAIGKAWGEWSVEDFADPSARAGMVAASGNNAAPSRVPAGLERMSSLWHAPFADYELTFIRNSSAAYFLCAAGGACLVIAFASLIASFGKAKAGNERNILSSERKGTRRNFVEKTTDRLLVSLQEAIVAEEFAHTSGFLQTVDPRVKLFGVMSLIAVSVAVHRLTALLVLFAASILLAAFSRIPPSMLLKRIWLPVLAFTGLLALPALFVVPGDTITQAPLVGWAITFPGLLSALLLVFRAETASTLSLLLVLSTPWNHLLRALRFFKVPITAIVILQMTQRYVFLLAKTAHNMMEARRARLVGSLDRGDQRRLMAATAGVLLEKSLGLSYEVHSAMQARGFRGEVYLLEDPQIRIRDRAVLAGFVAVSGLLFWVGR